MPADGAEEAEVEGHSRAGWMGEDSWPGLGTFLVPQTLCFQLKGKVGHQNQLVNVKNMNILLHNMF